MARMASRCTALRPQAQGPRTLPPDACYRYGYHQAIVARTPMGRFGE